MLYKLFALLNRFQSGANGAGQYGIVSMDALARL